jgi:hypothetical protein
MSSHAYLRYYSEIEGAFELAYMLNEHPKTLEIKVLYDECILDTIPGTAYKPSKLVKEFDYTKE